MTERPAIPVALRFRVFERDHFTCRYCGGRPPAIVLELDHVTPFRGGGEATEANLVTACTGCNGGKGARILRPAPVDAGRDVIARIWALHDEIGAMYGAPVDPFEALDDVAAALECARG